MTLYINACVRKNSRTNEVQGASKEMSHDSRVIVENIGTLQKEQSMGEMSASASKIDSAGSSLAHISKLMEQSIGEMGKQVDQFTV